MAEKLTQERFEAGMARTEKVACTPGDQRCLPLPYGVAGALATRTPKGRVKIGWIAEEAGRKAWDV